MDNTAKNQMFELSDKDLNAATIKMLQKCLICLKQIKNIKSQQRKRGYQTKNFRTEK